MIGDYVSCHPIQLERIRLETSEIHLDRDIPYKLVQKAGLIFLYGSTPHYKRKIRPE